MFSRTAPTPSPNTQIVVIEDQDASRRALSMLLRLNGYTPSAFSSGEEALHMLREGNHPAFALVDLDLPGMSGVDVIRELHELDPAICAVLLTAADEERVNAALKGAAVMYLQKPVNFDQLLALLNEHRHLDSLAI